MSQALAFGGVSPDELSWVCAHGTGTPLNDAARRKQSTWRSGTRPSAPRSARSRARLGHMFGAAGAISAVAAVHALREGIIPPTTNYETPDPQCDLDYVPTPPALRPWRPS